MMPAANEVLLDLNIRHQVNLLRYSNSVVRKIITLLNRVDADIVSQMLRRDPGAVSEGWSRKRLEAMLEAIREINRDAYNQVRKSLGSELVEVAKYETDWQRRAITENTVGFDMVSPTAEQLRAAVSSNPLQGKLLREWTADLDRASFARLRDSIRIGFVQGETIDQMVRRVRGTRALNYKDGILEISRRSARTMVQTAVSDTAHHARDLLYEANADVLKGLVWVATLDTRTCVRCANLDGKVFKLKKGPRPPLHFSCRCSTAPVTKSFRELGIDLDEAPAGTRASMDGQVPAKTTFKEWIARQPASVQDEVLGKAKGRLFRKGGLDIGDFVDATGQEYSLDELREVEGGAFTRAGL